MMKVLEKDVQKSIIDYLNIKGYFFYRNNTGGFRDMKNHFYRFGAVGSPDIVVVHCGKYIGIECKASDGKQSANQLKFQLDLEGAGGQYILAKSLDDVIEHL